MLTTEQIARLYSTEIYDYGAHRRQGTVVSSGTGLMLAIMDNIPARYCVDYDTAKENPLCRIEDFMRLVHHYAPPLIVTGWFTSTKPDALQRGLALVREDDAGAQLLTYSGGDIVLLDKAQSTELGAFFARVNAAYAIDAACG